MNSADFRLTPRDGIDRNKLLLVILDGVGVSPDTVLEGDAVKKAHLPILKGLWNTQPTIKIQAHGTAVGMPSDEDMGNSEVGHNVLGCGRIYDQGAKLVNRSIHEGTLFQGSVWKKLVQNALTNKSTLHFIGLVSDGNVHSHIDHLYKLIENSIKQGVKKIRIHALLDGRDVPEKSALKYIIPLETYLQQLSSSGVDIQIASGGGRMNITMDRYEADWSMVERGWKAHVLGIGRLFSSASHAIQTLQSEDTDLTDQYIPAFVIEKNGEPVGRIMDGDSVVFFNFRGDRAIEISRAFTESEFKYFDRVRFPKVEYAGMMQYDGDLMIPPQYLVDPPCIERTLSEYLVNTGLKQYAISETQKFGHVTYFWNGNRSGYFNKNLETYVEIKSDLVPFDQKPEMKAVEITDALIQALRENQYDFYRVNYANGDMVGHTGNMKATIQALETLDPCIGRLVEECRNLGIVLAITADHGNADEMYQLDKNGKPILDSFGNPIPKTSHTLNPVNFCIVDHKHRFRLNPNYAIDGRPGLANIAGTILDLLGYYSPEDYHCSLIERI